MRYHYDILPSWIENLWADIWPRFYWRFVMWRYRRRLWNANLQMARLAEVAQRGAETWAEFLVVLRRGS